MITDKIGYGCRLSLIGIQVAEGDAIFLELTFAPILGSIVIAHACASLQILRGCANMMHYQAAPLE